MNSRTTAMIPSTFTFLNLFCGFFSVLKSIEGDFHVAAWLVVICALIDAMDGRVARWTGAESRFGLQLDSLCDIVSFGLAPAVFMHQAVFSGLHPMMAIPLSFLFLFGGAYRLARFNVMNAELEDHQYLGLTIPIAAMTVTTFWLFQNAWFESNPILPWFFAAVLVPILMMSTIPYYWPKVSFRGDRLQRLKSAAILAGLALALVFPERTLFPMFCVFILSGIALWTVSLVRGEETVLSLFIADGRRES
jgi:CDP-diacylglycerol---serine O-phosphatidyltransferase